MSKKSPRLMTVLVPVSTMRSTSMPAMQLPVWRIGQASGEAEGGEPENVHMRIRAARRLPRPVGRLAELAAPKMHDRAASQHAEQQRITGAERARPVCGLEQIGCRCGAGLRPDDPGRPGVDKFDRDRKATGALPQPARGDVVDPEAPPGLGADMRAGEVTALASGGYKQPEHLRFCHCQLCLVDRHRQCRRVDLLDAIPDPAALAPRSAGSPRR